MRWTVGLLLAIVALAGCLQGDPDEPLPSGSSSPSASATSSSTGPSSPPSPPPADPGNGSEPLGPPREWAALDAATIRPGVQVVADGSQCTSNFLFTSPDNATVYLGFAAHCVTAQDPNSADDGCDPASEPLPLGTPVEVEGAEFAATLVYSSWLAMQEANETNGDACRYNDFAVAQLDARDAAKANPAMLFFGGPTRLASPGDASTFDKVLSYGDSGLRLGLSSLSPHEGYVVFPAGDGGWTTEVYTVPQGIPGDSGSGVLLGADGAALGVLVTISYLGGSNGVTSLENALAYASSAGLPLQLATAGVLNPGRLPPL
jgi:hypothetical protein